LCNAPCWGTYCRRCFSKGKSKGKLSIVYNTKNRRKRRTSRERSVISDIDNSVQ
jgi:hypothetical protein